MALAQLVLGSAVGARFSGTPLALIGRTLLLGAGATVIMLLVTLAFGGALARAHRPSADLCSCSPSSRAGSPR